MGKRGPKPLFGKPLTNAECFERWRKRHARRLPRSDGGLSRMRPMETSRHRLMLRSRAWGHVGAAISELPP